MTGWMLDPEVAYLNHGSFGATPLPVLAEQQRWRERLETNPVRFFDEEYYPALDAARRRLADFVGGVAANTVFVANATSGVNAVVSSLGLAPDDEIIVTDHEYNACRNAAEVATVRAGAKLVEVAIPFPPSVPGDVVDRVLEAVNGRTRLVVIDHVTSATGLVFPVEELIAVLEPDVPVLVDGAHAPGMLELDLAGLGASFYVGNLHKWVCAPKGTGFLTVAGRWVDSVLPPVISHGWNSPRPGRTRLEDLFDWAGTSDPSARLSVPVAIDTMNDAHPDGWPGVMAANHELVVEGAGILSEALGLESLPGEEWLGSMVSIVIPGQPTPGEIVDELTVILRHNHAIEVPVFGWGGRRLLRISAQRYNRPEDYQRLAAALQYEL